MKLNVKNDILYVAAIMILSMCGCTQQESGSGEYLVEIEAYDYAFLAPDEIPNGWITFRLENMLAHEIHELSFARLPEGIGFEEYLDEYVGAWEEVLRMMQDGEIEKEQVGETVSPMLPDWSEGVEYVNARGLVSPGYSAEKTVYLDPGNYVLDCWVKSPEGVIHISAGMARPLRVTEDAAESPEPDVANNILLLSESVETDWIPSTGKHSFALHYTLDETGSPLHNNIHLIRVEEDTDPDEVNTWLDWYRVGGLRAPAPADFLGGTSAYSGSPSGSDAEYFSVTISEPGEYAWIVQAAEGEQLWERFTVD